jgi:hypothetical protein
MWSLGAIGFVNPWFLVALAGLPVIWWLIRVTPPAPQRVGFPAIRLLFGLRVEETTPARTPLWLLILRLFLAALAILALSGPVLDPGARLAGNGPVVLVVDDGWSAARGWSARKAAAGAILDQAERAGRPVLLQTSAAAPGGEGVAAGKLGPVNEARARLAALEPKPWDADRLRTARALVETRLDERAEVIWLADNLDEGGAVALAERLQGMGQVRILVDPAERAPHALLLPELEGTAFGLKALRAGRAGPEAVWVRAIADGGRVLARQPLAFEEGATEATAQLELPTELRNALQRIEIEGEASAGAAVLLDSRWRRRPVGLISGAAAEADQPLLSELYYLDRALQPFAEVTRGSIDSLLQRPLAMMVLADVGKILGRDRSALERWINQGGVLVRFAGPRMADGADELVPVRLRVGGRALGGALTWEQPARIAPFGDHTPFSSLNVPNDVMINRQVLAEPALDLADRTWARLADGTPLVTAEKRGEGWLVLFHTTANPEWSNLPISGLFVEMLRRLVDLGRGTAVEEGTLPLKPVSVMDAFGRMGQPSATVLPIAARDIITARPSPTHPPGLYGPPDALRALNLTNGVTALKPLPEMPSGVSVATLSGEAEIDLMPWLLAAAIALGIADTLIALALRGLLGVRRVAAASAALLLAVAALANRAEAQTSQDDAAMRGTLELRLAHIVTGNAQVDQTAKAGLAGLTLVLARRTSVEAGEPVSLDIERDELLFYPLLYWPMSEGQPSLSDAAVAKVAQFMKTGGTILFDTRDQDVGGFGSQSSGPGAQALRRLLGRLDIPPLAPVPADHILTKAFYLTQEFPGRFAGGRVWVERHGRGSNDGVSPIIIGGNDWAAAWAIDPEGRAVHAVVPGGQRQREMAYRFGVNLVMYALTGNYKADQVHVPALLERLGQ